MPGEACWSGWPPAHHRWCQGTPHAEARHLVAIQEELMRGGCLLFHLPGKAQHVGCELLLPRPTQSRIA
jgi:hypothetical protein